MRINDEVIFEIPTQLSCGKSSSNEIFQSYKLFCLINESNLILILLFPIQIIESRWVFLQ